MKILAIADLHTQFEHVPTLQDKARDAEIIIDVGDHTLFGNGRKEYFDFIESLNKPCFVIHGNHETIKDTKEECRKRKNIFFINNKYFQYKDVLLMGHGGGGLSMTTPHFENRGKEFEVAMKLTKKSILIIHAPPYKTMDTVPGCGHVGNKTYKEFIERAQPTIVLCGHLHEHFHKHDKIRKSKVINPGPDGEIIEI